MSVEHTINSFSISISWLYFTINKRIFPKQIKTSTIHSIIDLGGEFFLITIWIFNHVRIDNWNIFFNCMHRNVENSKIPMLVCIYHLSNALCNEYSDAKTALLFDVVSILFPHHLSVNEFLFSRVTRCFVVIKLEREVLHATVRDCLESAITLSAPPICTPFCVYLRASQM